MKKIIFLLCITTMAITSAQNIKIKKGNILLDKIEKIGTSNYILESQSYSIKDLNENEILVKRVMQEGGNTSSYHYEIKANFNDGVMELPGSAISSGLAKGTIKYLINNGLWDTASGFDTNAITKKMQNTGTEITDSRKESKNNEDRVKAINPFVNREGEILKGGYEGTEVIGYVSSPDNYLATQVTPIEIYDINKNLIAKGKTKLLKGETFTTFDGKQHEFKVTKELNEILKPLFLSEVVYLLMLEGYIYEGKIPYDSNNSVFKK